MIYDDLIISPKDEKIIKKVFKHINKIEGDIVDMDNFKAYHIIKRNLRSIKVQLLDDIRN